MMFKVGDAVRIKPDAFPDAVPGSAAYVGRGRTGVIRASRVNGLIAVQVDDISAVWYLHCEVDEIEPIAEVSP